MTGVCCCRCRILLTCSVLTSFFYMLPLLLPILPTSLRDRCSFRSHSLVCSPIHEITLCASCVPNSHITLLSHRRRQSPVRTSHRHHTLHWHLTRLLPCDTPKFPPTRLVYQEEAQPSGIYAPLPAPYCQRNAPQRRREAPIQCAVSNIY